MADQPLLYCYKICKDGVIRKYAISNYTKVYKSAYTQRYCYVFKDRLGNAAAVKYEVSGDNVDRLVNNKLYTFSADDEANYRKIKQEIQDKRVVAWHKYQEAEMFACNILSKNADLFTAMQAQIVYEEAD